MSTRDKTRPELLKCAISHPYEREAIALLSQAGWSNRELAMVFEISESSVARLLDAEGVSR